jgi:hypothetical protein
MNMLFIFSDQHTRRAMGCAGHPVALTPNLDRLAAGGTLFRNAYCNGPICVPSRASLATGRHVHEIGIWDNARPYHGTTPSWGHRLMDQGHRATSIGKLHYRDTEDPNGFDEEIVPLHVIGGVGMLFTIIRDPMPVSRKFRMLVNESGGGETNPVAASRLTPNMTGRSPPARSTGWTTKPASITINPGPPSSPWSVRTRPGARPSGSTTSIRTTKSPGPRPIGRTSGRNIPPTRTSAGSSASRSPSTRPRRAG